MTPQASLLHHRPLSPGAPPALCVSTSTAAALWPSIKAGARRRPLRVQLTEAGAPLTGLASVTVRMRDSAGLTVLEAAMTVVDDATGLWGYAWADGDTDVPGNYALEFHLVDDAALPDVIPERGTVFFVIEAPIAAA